MISHQTLHPLKGCVLLILGERDWAVEVWKLAPPEERTGVKNHQPNFKSDPYLALVRNWAWAHFDRTVSRTHSRR